MDTLVWKRNKSSFKFLSEIKKTLSITFSEKWQTFITKTLESAKKQKPQV